MATTGPPGRMSGREKFLSTNTLVCLLQALQGRRTTVELRAEAKVEGQIADVDGFMNVTLTEATFTDAADCSAPFDRFFVHGRQIRYVHIPDEVSPLQVMEEQLQRLQNSRRGAELEAQQQNKSRRTKKAEKYTRDTVKWLRGGRAAAAVAASASSVSGRPARAATPGGAAVAAAVMSARGSTLRFSRPWPQKPTGAGEAASRGGAACRAGPSSRGGLSGDGGAGSSRPVPSHQGTGSSFLFEGRPNMLRPPPFRPRSAAAEGEGARAQQPQPGDWSRRGGHN